MGKLVMIASMALILSACADPNTCPDRFAADTAGVLIIGLPMGSITKVPCHTGDTQNE